MTVTTVRYVLDIFEGIIVIVILLFVLFIVNSMDVGAEVTPYVLGVGVGLSSLLALKLGVFVLSKKAG